jgi:hypothetical protein
LRSAASRFFSSLLLLPDLSSDRSLSPTKLPRRPELLFSSIKARQCSGRISGNEPSPEAKDALSRYGTNDEVAFAVFDEELTVLADLPSWAALGERARAASIDGFLKKDSLTWKGTDIGGAMVEAA